MKISEVSSLCREDAKLCLKLLTKIHSTGEMLMCQAIFNVVIIMYESRTIPLSS